MAVPITCVFFDLDDTLTHEGFEPVPPLCDDAVDVLARCRALGLRVAIVSHNSNAAAICAATGLDAYIDAYIAESAYDKFDMLRRAMAHFDVAPQACVLFDDMQEHVRTARAMGMRGVHVSWVTGVTRELFERSIV